ncbi:Nif3-like dinuclear metal center hexameric protein [Alkalihalobacillus macyae]|uniref:Nif3-like dinuclear metal center hexameric protein n=1 Tax=Guptibacillus hwajinpoensis TaxID=208199 RepID=UPI00273B5F9E|nr:Nif3-like dinuclear metal center hexameric protein [Alkalihalobacillus macyae]MDP4550103.1 Nif3-like dinuclear metal center hexameric protein [Alkalihalobacillus macyae]
MEELLNVVQSLDNEFGIERFGVDPTFSRFIPQVYNNKFDWKDLFEPRFTKLFNGLMIKGNATVQNIFLAVFPTNEVLEQFIEEGEAGDMLFMHHPLLMECGDPNGKWGRGFVPIDESLLNKVVSKGVSIYTCHAPLDYHRKLGTSQAIAEELKVDITERFIHSENYGDIGIIGKIKTTDTECLINQLKKIFDIPYVDFEGTKNTVEKVAIVAGCGDKTKWIKFAEDNGVDAYISGEIHCHMNNDYGRSRFKEIENYATHTNISLIGVSHSASEYLVKKTLLYKWFEKEFDFNSIKLIPQSKWWL